MFIMGNRRKKSKYSKYNESGGLWLSEKANYNHPDKQD
jgi:hypothetical protein